MITTRQNIGILTNVFPLLIFFLQGINLHIRTHFKRTGLLIRYNCLVHNNKWWMLGRFNSIPLENYILRIKTNIKD